MGNNLYFANKNPKIGNVIKISYRTYYVTRCSVVHWFGLGSYGGCFSYLY
jgi:hypothetical protein